MLNFIFDLDKEFCKMKKHFFSFILCNVYINLVASNSDISTNSSIPVKFRNHNYNFGCLTRSGGSLKVLQCNPTSIEQKFYIDNLQQINYKLANPSDYPTSTVRVKDIGGKLIVAFENIRFEKFDNLTWFFVHVDDGTRCLSTFYGNDYQFTEWHDCYKKDGFPEFDSQKWDIENW
jgi:hypothetical protein